MPLSRRKLLQATMFAKAASGALSPEGAVKEAEQRYRRLWDKWADRKLL